MKRILSSSMVLAIASLAVAQPPPPPKPGYMVIRVKVNADANVAAPMAVPGQPAIVTTDMAKERSVFAVIPYKNAYEDVVYTGKPLNFQMNPKVWWISHEQGKSLVFQDKNIVQIYTNQNFLSKVDGTAESQLKARYTLWQRSKGKAEELMAMAIEAFNCDLVELAMQYSKELADNIQNYKMADNRTIAYATKYKELMGKFAENYNRPEDANEWKKRLQAVDIVESPHYSLIHLGQQVDSPQFMNNVLTELERNFKAFYIWHAINAQSISFPTQKLVVVLASKASDMTSLRNKLDAAPIVSDSFFVQHHQLVVLSPERMDEDGRLFSTMTKNLYAKGWHREDLIKGKNPAVSAQIKFEDIISASTYSIADFVLEREAIHAAVSRECTRQLYFALGTLPQHVIIPKWIDNGVASLLAKPKDPGVVVIANEKLGAAIGTRAGYGAANFLMQREWRALEAKKELAKSPEDLLKKVLTDAYFDGVRTGRDPDSTEEAALPGTVAEATIPSTNPVPSVPVPPRGGRPLPGPEGGGRPLPMGGGTTPEDVTAPPQDMTPKAKLERKAHATSWALTFFITRPERANNLKNYYAELNKLPRDLRLEKKTTVDIFCKSFGLWNDTNNAIDEVKFAEFAGNWTKYINAIAPTWIEIPLEATSTEINPMNPNPNPMPVRPMPVRPPGGG